MDIVELRKEYLASEEPHIDAAGREAEIEYRNFLLEYILRGEGFNELDEDMFEFKDATENERTIREAATYVFKTIPDPKALKAIFNLLEAVFNFAVFSDIPVRLEESAKEAGKIETARKAGAKLAASDRQTMKKRSDIIKEMYPKAEKLSETIEFATEIRKDVLKKIGVHDSKVKKRGYSPRSILRAIQEVNRERGHS